VLYLEEKHWVFPACGRSQGWSEWKRGVSDLTMSL